MNLFRELLEGLRISWSCIRANKMRSVLTTLGIVIGILTVTLMGTAIQALNRAFLNSISAIGADVLYVERNSWFNHSREDWLRTRNRQPITFAQVEAVREELTSARAVVPFAMTRRPVQFEDRRSDLVTVIGTSDQFFLTSGVGVTEGRFLSAAEVAGGRPVCVLGAAVATNLFLGKSAVGNQVRITHYAFEVVGVLEKQGNFLGQFSLDNQVVVPVQQFIACFRSFPDFQIQVKASGLASLEETREELRGILRKLRRVPPTAEDDFAINQQEAFVETFHRVAGTIAAVGLFITGLSLFVGGIGIMNIMFVSVAERTREIGIRKAIGAKRRAILVQFLSEAASICLLGAVVALGIAWPVTLFMKRFLPATLSPVVVGAALLVAALTGIISGFLPAWRAARMNPVDALRQE